MQPTNIGSEMLDFLNHGLSRTFSGSGGNTFEAPRPCYAFTLGSSSIEPMTHT